jgi:hypothetical protein
VIADFLKSYKIMHYKEVKDSARADIKAMIQMLVSHRVNVF